MAYKEKSDAIRYNNNYIKQAYDRINLTVPKGRGATIKAVAKQNGESVNGFINRLIDAELARLGEVPGGCSENEPAPDFPNQ